MAVPRYEFNPQKQMKIPAAPSKYDSFIFLSLIGTLFFWSVSGSVHLGAALMKQDKTVSNRGVQHNQHRFHTTSWQDNPVGKGYLT